MKIALVSPYDYNYPGGVGNHISALSREFIKMGHTTCILAPGSGKNPELSGNYVPIGRSIPFPGSGSVARITLSPWLSGKVKTILEREKFDIIHLHEPLCPALCTTVLGLSKTANIGTFHAVDSRSYLIGRPLTTPFLKKWFNKLDGRITVSKTAMEFTYKHFPADYCIIPNGVDIKHFSPDVLPLKEFNDGKINILFVGRQEKRKGLNYLFKAYELVRREIPDSRLIIVGPSSRWSRKYEKQIMRERQNSIVFTGSVAYTDLPNYYRTADLVCSPATGRESFGMVLLEAMAVGKSIVASDLPGYSNILTHGIEGLMVSPGDVQGLADAIVTLIKDEHLRKEMGARGKLKASKYRWERVAEKVIEYYELVI
jgi:phosphatidylinositol alpha-mannosyltransferase